jgi:hypothetical protein
MKANVWTRLAQTLPFRSARVNKAQPEVADLKGKVCASLVQICPAMLVFLFAAQARAAQAPATFQKTALDVDQYIAELESKSAAAGRLKDHPDEAARLLAQLPAEWVVTARGSGGQTYSIPTAWLRSRIGALDSDHSRAAEISGELVARLDAMRAGAQELSSVHVISISEARATLETILKRREFRGVAGPSPMRTWWNRFTDWLTDKVMRFFGGIGRHRTLSSSIVWLLAAAVGLFLLAWLVRSMLRVSRTTRLQLESPPAGKSEDWGRQALACADRGDYREAIHLAYGLALARLEESGLLEASRARTPREYLRLLPGEHARRPPFAALTARFERAWYAGREVCAEDFRGALAELGDLGCHLNWSRATADFS